MKPSPKYKDARYIALVYNIETGEAIKVDLTRLFKLKDGEDNVARFNWNPETEEYTRRP